MRNNQHLRELYYALKKKKLTKLQSKIFRLIEADLLYTYFISLGTYCFSTYERVSFGFSPTEYINKHKKYYQIAVLFQEPFTDIQFLYEPTEIYWNADIRHCLQAQNREIIEFSSCYPFTEFDTLTTDQLLKKLCEETGKSKIYHYYRLQQNWTVAGLWFWKKFVVVKDRLEYSWLKFRHRQRYKDDESLPF
ncbi:MAG TPA: hypothetical protein PKY82_34335 [Pyrinomonadaceae bacterium]|nr:hypothetical protein [Pyrinomonadaceae bacterium]